MPSSLAGLTKGSVAR